MKLEKIKLSGFKSFVDSTVIPISGNLTAIVGPNGCGKSNIIDAVRWVMGESSAKHLRGGSMADVIFNGSASRKPVGTASVELIFDNGEGKAGGEYAQYNSISIKRQVSRDGQSAFLLNNVRCRRKDITDLFLGTGLGSRSYAIIEQGTISRMVEAKPEDLRVHIEEAAGISKYKERRQETETRMRHTHENLERLNDVRDEVEKQLKHLQKQAEKAKKYTELKQQERQFKLELLAMRWQAHHRTFEQLDSQMKAVADEHNRLFVASRELDAEIESKRSEHKKQQAALNSTQGDFYHVVSEVGRLEQTIKLNQKSHEETVVEIDRLKQQIDHAKSELDSDQMQLEDITSDLIQAEETLEVMQARVNEAVSVQQDGLQERADWQRQWEAYLKESASAKENIEIQRIKISQTENQNRQLQIRLDKLNGERDDLKANPFEGKIDELNDLIVELEEERSEVHDRLDKIMAVITEHRLLLKEINQQVHAHRSEMHNVKGKITSLEMLQQHAMGKDNKHLNSWLEQMDLAKETRLAEMLEVEAGWETAAETVLGHYLEAICIDNADSLIPALEHLTNESLALFENRQFDLTEQTNSGVPLLDKVKASWNLSGLLTGIYCAESLVLAKAQTDQLKPYESLILPDGTWLGPGWLRLIKVKDNKSGVLQREKELRLLKQRQDSLSIDIAELEARLETSELVLKEAEANREILQQNDKTLSNDLSKKNAELSAFAARHEQQQQRLRQIDGDLTDIQAESEDNAELIAEAKFKLQDAEQRMAGLDESKQHLEKINQQLMTQQHSRELSVSEAKQQVFSYQAQIESLRSSKIHITRQVERLEVQMQTSSERMAELEHKLEATLTPLDDEKLTLEQLYLEKEELEHALKLARKHVEETEQAINRLSQEHIQHQRGLEKQKEQLDKLRYEQQESRVRQQTVTEQLDELAMAPEAVLQKMPSDADETVWKNKVDDLAGQIERLGTINLSAIEEFQLQSERMKFLNDQHADLSEALDTLTQAINKIDKESRQRFKETFDKINAGLQQKFPKLFGGGQAYLELTDQDVLDAGVNIIARPPGKRNSSIHLLSGGEKALTAVALVFSIFELNPAPFCLLDEVDAPLDDANVGRFSKMVEEMSETVQFLFISHNKATMEIAKQLAGVTMREPGVSRMVAVDIEEAVSLAES
jgi:chromosome segregation protein